MKRITLLFLLWPIGSFAMSNCRTTVTYTACKAGYYLASDKTDCIKCPDGSTSDDKNDSGISECYLPINKDSTKPYEDNTGSFITNGICYHK